MNNQLELSSRPIPSPQVLAVNLDYFSIIQRCPSIAVFLRGGECLCIPHASQDADAVLCWASTQLGEQFLTLPSHLFNVAAITSTAIDGAAITIAIAGIEVPFSLPATRNAKAALFAWTGEDDGDMTEPRAVAVLV